jgi:alkaline phosphatase D
MSLSRRQFLWTAAASSVCLPALLEAQRTPTDSSAVFRHGVASGDPLDDRVILWTRVTPAASATARDVDVRWLVATDEQMTRVVRRGTARTSAARDFTVKADVGGLDAGRTYFYTFEMAGERSRIGRTKTLPKTADRVQLGLVCCSNYPAGFFNVYACLARRDALDAIVHVGDYIYEFQNGIYGDGTSLLRIPEPRREAVTLSDYRIRYATYRTDPDLQDAHARHPFIVVWDDHELTNDAWSHGGGNHNPEQGEGDWPTRRAAAYRAYLEWMPIRESDDRDVHLYRDFRFGSIARLTMLDTRGLRDQQVAPNDIAALTREERTLLGSKQESWLFDRLRSSQRADESWRILGQQVVFSRLALPGRPIVLNDTWDGYQAARERVLDFIERDRIRDLVILSGDIHSSWAFDVPRNAWDGYDAASGAGSLAVEIVAPAISSPPLFTNPLLRAGEPGLRDSLPHLKFLEGESNGYVLLDVTRERFQSDWYLVPTVSRRSDEEKRVKRLVTERGSAHLMEG